MKSRGAAKNEANDAAQAAPEKAGVMGGGTEGKVEIQVQDEKIDFSKVEIEPLFEETVDFDTFSKSDFRAVKVLACEAVLNRVCFKAGKIA